MKPVLWIRSRHWSRHEATLGRLSLLVEPTSQRGYEATASLLGSRPGTISHRLTEFRLDWKLTEAKAAAEEMGQRLSKEGRVK